MSDSTVWAALASTAADPRLYAAMAVSVVAGLVRGFTGFGSALIYVPLVAAIYDPRVAAATLILTDTICTTPFALRAVPHCNWREVLPVFFASAVTIPLGVMALLWIDPLILRWFIAALVIVALLALVTGWRYRGRPTLAASLGVGAAAGFGAGAVQIGGPPVLVFWLGGNNDARTVRANIMTYFIGQDTLSLVLYFFSGLFSPHIAVLALLIGVPFAIAVGAGSHWFHGSSEKLYRRIAYIIIAIAGIVSLPLFDALR